MDPDNGISTLICLECYNEVTHFSTHVDKVQKTQRKISAICGHGNSSIDDQDKSEEVKENSNGKPDQFSGNNAEQKTSNKSFGNGEKVACFDMKLQKRSMPPSLKE